jgi:hypothetical protein
MNFSSLVHKFELKFEISLNFEVTQFYCNLFSVLCPSCTGIKLCILTD